MVQLKRSVFRIRVQALLLCALSLSQVSPLFADGLTGEYLSTQYWRDLHSRYSPLTNPAFMTEENYLSFRFAGSYVLQNYGLFELGATLPVGLYESWGFSWFSQTSGAINVTGIDPSGGVTDSGKTLSDWKNLFMVSYANNIWGRLSVGANLAINVETNFNDPPLRDFHCQLQSIATGRILDPCGCIRIGQRSRVARMLKMIENLRGIHCSWLPVQRALEFPFAASALACVCCASRISVTKKRSASSARK